MLTFLGRENPWVCNYYIRFEGFRMHPDGRESEAQSNRVALKGDVLVAINDKDVSGMILPDIVNLFDTFTGNVVKVS